MSSHPENGPVGEAGGAGCFAGKVDTDARARGFEGVRVWVDVPWKYQELFDVLMSAFHQAERGKGAERHANNLPFVKQTIFQTAGAHGLGFLTGQAEKKAREAHVLLASKGDDACVRELLGAIVYLAAAVIHVGGDRDA